MTFRNSALWLAILAALAGCGDEKPLGRLTEAYGVFGAPAAKAPRALPGGDRVRVGFGDASAVLVLTRVDADGSRTYQSLDDVSITLLNGVMTRLRGVGKEFEALYLPSGHPLRAKTIAQIAEEGETYDRVMEFWIERQPRRIRFVCVIEPAETARREYLERCRSLYDGAAFTNVYVLDRDERPASSRQVFYTDTSSVTIVTVK